MAARLLIFWIGSAPPHDKARRAGSTEVFYATPLRLGGLCCVIVSITLPFGQASTACIRLATIRRRGQNPGRKLRIKNHTHGRSQLRLTGHEDVVKSRSTMEQRQRETTGW